ncbi:MAG TPA: EamA family transporter [Kofleriaceae bacterium]|jgi:drug/metabolite transporter (DMT)-like permease
MSSDAPPRGLLVACLACVYIVWGSVYLAMQVAIEDMGPLTMGGLRFLLAGVILYAIATRKTKVRPTLRDWRSVLPIGVTLFLGGNGFIAIAVEKTARGTIPSGTVGVVAAMESLWIAILGVFFGVRPTRREILALVSGFIGIVILTRGPATGGDPMHFVILLLSPVLWAVGSLLARSLKSQVANDPLLLPAMQMIVGGIVMLIVAPLHGEHLPTHVGLWPALAFTYCVIFGSLVTFTAYSWLLRNTRPLIATSYAFVNPTIAVLLGAAIHGEALGVNVLIANAMMVIAIWLAISRPRP